MYLSCSSAVIAQIILVNSSKWPGLRLRYDTVWKNFRALGNWRRSQPSLSHGTKQKIYEKLTYFRSCGRLATSICHLSCWTECWWREEPGMLSVGAFIKTALITGGASCSLINTTRSACLSLYHNCDSITATTVVQEEEQLSWLLWTPSGPKISVDRFFWLAMNSSMRLKSGWMDSQKYFILLLMKTPRSLQTVHWQRQWVCWKIKICSFVYLSFKWVRLKTFWPPLVMRTGLF